MKVNATITGELDEKCIITHNEHSMNGQQFTKEQVSQIINIYKKMGHAGTSGSEINANSVADTILKYSGSCFKTMDSCTWIIASSASEHMCYDFNSFLFLTPLPVPLNIILPYSFKITVTQIGSVSIQPHLTLRDVLYVPDFRYNLLSIHKLCSQLHCTAFFNSCGCMLQAPFMRKAQAFGDVREGLYLLQQDNPQSNKGTSNSLVHVHKKSVRIVLMFLFQSLVQCMLMIFLV